MPEVTVVFFLAFLSFVWLLGLPAYWLFFSSSAERRGAFERLEWYRKQRSWRYGLLKVFFLAVNAYSLFPIRGALVAIGIITVFLIVQR